MIEPVKVIAPMATPSAISNRLAPLMAPIASASDAEGLRRIERGGRHQHRGKADERVEESHELRHLRHLHALGDNGADAAADGEAATMSSQPEPLAGGLKTSVVDDGDAHADHAEQVALPRGRGMREARAAPG